MSCLRKGLVFTVLFGLIGCVSTGKKTYDGREISKLSSPDILNAKIGMCGNLIPDDIVIAYLNSDPKLSPKENSERRDRAIKSWKNKVDKLSKENYSSKLYSFIIPIQHGQKVEEDYKLRLENYHEVTYSYGHRLDADIPEKVFFYADTRPVSLWHLTYPFYIIDHNKDSFSKASRVKLRMGDFYGEKSQYTEQLPYYLTQVTTNWRDVPTEKTVLHGNKDPRSTPSNVMGINIEIPKWYDDEKSVVQKDKDGFYINLNLIEHDEEYFNYKDSYNHNINVEYIFSISHCTEGKLYGKIKEVTVLPDVDSFLFKNNETPYYHKSYQ